MLKAIARNLTPPAVWSGLKSIKGLTLPAPEEPGDEPALFDGDDELFLAAADGIEVYHEYGVGASTLWIDSHTKAKIFGVDTSLEWIEKVSASLTRDEHSLTHVDVGPIGDWGYPQGFSQRANFKDYVDGPWRIEANANLVLIDGRFRISCFFNTLLRGAAGTRIIFDDYVKRPAYHVVEEFIAPIQTSDRQALFIIPDRVDEKPISLARDEFLMVRE